MSNFNLLQDRTELFNGATGDVRKFISNLVDADSFVQLGTFMVGASALSGDETPGEGVVTGYATIDGSPVYLFAHNAGVLGGSFGFAQARKIISVMNKAIEAGVPFISIIDCSGARVGEGVDMLEGYSALLSTAVKLKYNVPSIAIVKGKCVGMMATYCATADFVLAGKDAVVSFNPPTVVAAKEGINKPLNEVFGAAQSKSELITATFADVAALRAQVCELLSFTELYSTDDSDDPNRIDEALSDCTSVYRLSLLVDNGRYFEYAPHVGEDTICAFARINGMTVGIICSNTAVSDLTSMPAIKKATAFVKVLVKFDIPLVTLVDSNGVKTCYECELKCASQRTADLIEAIAQLPSKVSAIVGNAVGFAYTAFCSKSLGYGYSLAVCDAVLSPVASSVAVDLFADEIAASTDPLAARSVIEQKYVVDCANPFIAAKDGYVDNIIEPKALRPYIANALLMVSGR